MQKQFKQIFLSSILLTASLQAFAMDERKETDTSSERKTIEIAVQPENTYREFEGPLDFVDDFNIPKGIQDLIIDYADYDYKVYEHYDILNEKSYNCIKVPLFAAMLTKINEKKLLLTANKFYTPCDSSGIIHIHHCLSHYECKTISPSLFEFLKEEERQATHPWEPHRTDGQIISAKKLAKEQFKQLLVKQRLDNKNKLINYLRSININLPISCESKLGPNIIISSKDNSIIIWNLQTKQLFQEFPAVPGILDIMQLDDGRIVTLSEVKYKKMHDEKDIFTDSNEVINIDELNYIETVRYIHIFKNQTDKLRNLSTEEKRKNY